MRRLVLGSAGIAYGLGVIAVTVFPIRPRPPEYWRDEPFSEIFHWIPGDVDAPSLVLNVLMFVPFGVLLPLLRRSLDSYRRIGLHALLASSTIELIQLLLGLTLGSRRTVDVNDLIANTAGALLGLILLRLAVPVEQHRARAATGGPGLR